MRRALFALLFALPLACGGDDLTQIMVVVGTDVSALDGVRIEWSGLDEPGSRDIAFSAGRPALLPLVHRGGPLGPLVITAQGLVDGTAAAPVRSAQVSFVEGEVRMLRLDLLQSCVSASCGTETCVGDGRCAPIDSPEAARLEPWTGDPGDVDGGVEPIDGGRRDMSVPDMSMPDGCPDTVETCNDVDDDCDGDVDEGVDFASDPANCGECGVTCSSCSARVCEGSYVALAAGDSHTCATDDAGAVYCWGRNTFGQLGDGTFDQSSTPVDVSGLPASPAVQLGAGAAFSCARLESGEVWCWGSDGQEQRGDGPGGGGLSPSEVQLPIGGATDLAVGAAHACAIVAGDVHCWGANGDGQIGNGTSGGTVDTPAAVGLTAPVELAAGAAHSCALLGDGEIHCWGSGSDSQLGVSSPASDTPVRVNAPGGVTFTAVAGGDLFNCATTDDGGAYCWGRGGDGALGYGALSTSAVPREVNRIGASMGDALPGLTGLDAGGAHACAVLFDGRVACWGSDAEDQLGDPGTLSRATEPVLTSDLATAVVVAAGASHTCARLVDGSLRCWGANGAGQLGTGDRESSSVPVAVLPLTP